MLFRSAAVKSTGGTPGKDKKAAGKDKKRGDKQDPLHDPVRAVAYHLRGSKGPESRNARLDDYQRIDSNGLSESQEYEYTPNPNGHTRIFRKDKKGQWVQHYVNPETKRLVQSRGCGLRLGAREKYYDFSF